MNRRDHRHIVLGLGASAARGLLAARTARHDVLGIEQFDLDHAARRLAGSPGHHPSLLPHAGLRAAGAGCLRGVGDGGGQRRAAHFAHGRLTWSRPMRAILA